MDLAFYSTYCGSTENKTFNPQPVESAYPYFFISNNEEVLSDSAKVGYSPIFLQMEVTSNPDMSAYQAKVAKVLPHLIDPLMEYDFLLYKDDKISISAEKIENSVRMLMDSDSSTSIRPHPFLSGNILYEFGESMLQTRYKSQWHKTVTYITEELKNGAQLNCQMYATGVILRNMRHPDTAKINNLWWEHINRCGIECQISFDIIAQQFNSIILLPLQLE
jgi:hypothetical protein